MLLEYFDTKLFKKLNDLQSKNDGFFREISILESIFIDGQQSELIESFKEWQTPQIQNWIKIEPRLSEVDLRNYFWLFRDKTESTLSDVHMVSPVLQKIYKGLTSNKESEVRVNLIQAKELNNDELLEIIRLFDNEIKISSSLKTLLDNLHKLVIQIDDIDFYTSYIDILKSIPYQKISKLIYIVDRLEQVKQNATSLNEAINKLIVNYSEKDKGHLKSAANKYLEKGD
jgi:hypothetical protein